jgi:hypothetical protein
MAQPDAIVPGAEGDQKKRRPFQWESTVEREKTRQVLLQCDRRRRRVGKERKNAEEEEEEEEKQDTTTYHAFV